MTIRWFPIALLLAATPAEAGKAVVWGAGGVAIPEAPPFFTNHWREAIGVVGGIGYRTGPWLEIGAAVSIDRFGPDGKKVAQALLPGEDLTNVGVDGGDATVMFFSGETRLFFPLSLSRFSLWVSGAGGFWRRSFESVTVALPEDGGGTTTLDIASDEKLAVAAGAGFGVRIGREVWLTGEASYQTTLTSEVQTKMVPIRIGLAYR